MHGFSLRLTAAAALVLGALLAAAGAGAEPRADDDGFAAARSNLAAEVGAAFRQIGGLPGSAELDARVLNALATVPRHRFVPPEQRPYAYRDRPLPIGFGQTISQPFVVAVMTDLLALDGDDVVFELGTGSGYQAAVLAGLARRVYSVEIVEPLARRARSALEALGYDNVTVRAGDGYFGWPEHAPFDAIIVTAAGDHIPPPLVQQLKPGGRMVIPVGSPFLTQQLVLVEKQADGAVVTRELLPVRFVPLTGAH